jgi:hypothetical protein
MGIAIDLGQNVTDDIANGKEHYARAKRPWADQGQVDHRTLARANQVGQQQDRDKGHHHIIEIAKVATRAALPSMRKRGIGSWLSR